jgi:hypothetical protein
LLGPAAGEQHATERLVLTSTTPVTLRYTGIQTSSVVVLLATDGSTVNPGNYKIVQGADPNTGVTGDEPYTIERDTIPATGPNVALGGAGVLTGTYQYAVSFVNARGETQTGPNSPTITPTSQAVNLTAIALGPTGTSARNIYREKVVSGVGQGKRLVATIADNTTTTLTNENTSDATAATAAQPVVGINSGDTVLVSYDYTDQNYYAPTLLNNYDDIVDKYGAPFDSNGNISSQLSFSARFLLLNGASEVLCTAVTGQTSTDYAAGLEKLESQPDVRLVTASDGSSSVNGALVSHADKMNAQGLYRQAVVGQDGSSTSIPATTLRSSAKAYNNEAVMLVSPASFAIVNPVTSRPLNIGGQYVANAVAGMWAGRDVQFPLTRRTVAGFSAINDIRTASDLALDSASGLLVVESLGGVMRVRHSVTTAVGSVNTAEGSVVRAKYDMAHRLKSTLDSAVVGVVVAADRAPLLVQGVVAGVLDTMILEGAINSYSDVVARTLTGDPTTVEVRFQYLPAFPINNIIVRFTVNTQSGDLSLTTA